MAPATEWTSISRASPLNYDEVETNYDPGQLIASEEAPQKTPIPDPSKARAKKMHVTNQDYKPTALRWWFHGALIASLSALIGLTEYTIRTLQVYKGYDSVAQLWSREDSLTYRAAERKAILRDKHFQRITRAFGNETTMTDITSGTTAYLTEPSAYLNAGTSITVTITTTPETNVSPNDVETTTPSTVSPTKSPQSQSPHDTGHVITVASPTSSTTVEPNTTTSKAPSTSIPDQTSEESSTPMRTVASSSKGKDPTAGSVATTTTDLRTTATSAYMQIGPTSSTTTDTEPLVSSVKTAALQIGTTTSKSSSVKSPIEVSVLTPTTLQSITTSSASSSYMQIGPTSSTNIGIDLTTTSSGNAALQIGSTISKYSSVVSPTTGLAVTPIVDPETTINLDTISDNLFVPTSSSKVVTQSKTTSDSSGTASAESASSSEYLVVGPTPTPGTIGVASDIPSPVVSGKETERASKNILGPIFNTVLQDTAASETPSVAIVQETKAWAPAETTIEQTTTDSEGRSTVQVVTTTLPGGTSIFQSVPGLVLSSESHQVTVIQQTEMWPTSETIIEQVTTDPEGRSTVQIIATTLPGSTSIFQSTSTLSSESHQVTVIQKTVIWPSSETTMEQITTDSEGRSTVQLMTKALPASTSIFQSTSTVSPADHQVTVIQQTETWPSSETIIEQTITNADGDIVVQTLTTDLRGGTSVIRSSVSVLPGETLVTVPTVMSITIGASTTIIQTTLLDSKGHTTISSYTAVLGGTPTSTTRSYFVATSLPPEVTVLTVPTVVPTVIGGTAKVQETTFTNANGALETSSYTTILDGTPTSATISIVIATPVPSGDVLVTLSTVIPTTIGGTTEVSQTTFTNAQGHLTTSSYTTVLHGTPTSTTEWTIVPTPTSGSANASSNNPNTNGDTKVTVYGLGNYEYMLGTFLPTILAVLVAYPVKLISINARLMQPFHALATADEVHGAALKSSLFLRFDRWLGALSLPRAILSRQPVIAISDLLALGAALLPPIAAEAVSVHVPDGCHSHCFGILGVSIVQGRILEALMATMAALLIALIVLLSVCRWRTGVSQNPWSIAGMASLCLNTEIRDKLLSIPRGLDGVVEDPAILKVLGDSRFRLAEFWTSPNPATKGSREYGVVITGPEGVAKNPSKEGHSGREEAEDSKAGNKRTQPFVLLTWWGRCILLFVFSCVLIILVYYENTSGDTGFERFMDSQGFGVGFFFTALGVVLGMCMETVFRCVATTSPYLQLSSKNLPAERSILLSPPTNAFYGIYSAVRQRHPFLGVLSLTTILGELCLPVTLSLVPFSLLETYRTQLVCAWLSIAILCLMILVLVSSFLVTWPHMPVDPRTVAGAMFYVCDSSVLLGTLQGMSTAGKKDRDLDVNHSRLRYEYRCIEGAVGGKGRMGVDVCSDTGEAAVLMRGDKVLYG